MPGGVVDTPRDEHKWERAKEIAAEAGKGGDYAYIMGIYKKMKPDHDFKSSSGDTMSETQRLAQSIERLAEEVRTAGSYNEGQLERIIEFWSRASSALMSMDRLLDTKGRNHLNDIWSSKPVVDLMNHLMENGASEDELGF